jgi:hypothetical protein
MARSGQIRPLLLATSPTAVMAAFGHKCDLSRCPLCRRSWSISGRNSEIGVRRDSTTDLGPVDQLQSARGYLLTDHASRPWAFRDGSAPNNCQPVLFLAHWTYSCGRVVERGRDDHRQGDRSVPADRCWSGHGLRCGGARVGVVQRSFPIAGERCPKIEQSNNSPAAKPQFSERFRSAPRTG